jgi:hypothetical protein
MVFSDTTTKQGIIQACERYCNKGDAGISGVPLLLLEFTAHVNEVNRRAWFTIFSAYGGWQYDDANYTDLPAATTDLTTNITTYALPTGSLSVRGIEIKDVGNVWYPLIPLNEEQIRDSMAMSEFENTPGQPRYYQLVGQTIRVFPAANYTQASSFKVYFDRGSVSFVSTDTTQSPGFVSEFHGIIPLGASLEYLKIKMPGDATTAQLEKDYEVMKLSAIKYYTMKYEQMFPPKVMVRDYLLENL